MNELLQAAKAVIESWDRIWIVGTDVKIKKLRAAVERAESPPAGFEEWYQRMMDDDNASLQAKDCWKIATQFERERIKEIIRYEFGGLVSDLSDVMERIDET